MLQPVVRVEAALQSLRPRDIRNLLAQLHDFTHPDRHSRRATGNDYGPRGSGEPRHTAYPPLQAFARGLRPFPLLGHLAIGGADCLHSDRAGAVPAIAAGAWGILGARRRVSRRDLPDPC